MKIDGIHTKVTDETPIDAKGLWLGVRTRNCLMNLNCKTVGDARRFSDAELMRAPNFGRRSLNELRKIIGPQTIPRSVPIPQPQVVTIQVFPDVVLTWDPKTGVWQDKTGNSFNLWRIPR